MNPKESACEVRCENCPAFPYSAFANLDSESLDFLHEQKTLSSFSNKQIFSEKGKPADVVYCLQAGAAKVHLTNPDGQRSIVRLVAPGDMLGYRCIFSAETFRGTASSINTSTACRISKNTIFQLIERNKKFAIELLARMGQEIATAEMRHQSFCQKNVRERLAEALLLLQEKFGAKSSPRIPMLLTRKELANWMGAAKETVIRTLSDFKDEGLIEIAEDSIWVLQPELLRQVAIDSSQSPLEAVSTKEKFSAADISSPM